MKVVALARAVPTVCLDTILISVERIFGRIFVEIFLFSLFCRFRNHPGATDDRPHMQTIADRREDIKGSPKRELLPVKSAYRMRCITKRAPLNLEFTVVAVVLAREYVSMFA